MGQMAGTFKPWKTVTVAEDHYANNDNQVYWATLFGLYDQNDFD